MEFAERRLRAKTQHTRDGVFVMVATDAVNYAPLVALRIRHLLLLCRDVLRFALTNRAWWFVPLVVLLGLISLGVSTAQAVVPVAVYTLF